MNAYRALVQRYQDALAHPLPSSPFFSFTPREIKNAGKTALLFSPHPDDECLIGALPLRLQREQGWRIVNIAVTLGSNSIRRDARRAELEAACSLLGWENVVLGWTDLNPEARQEKSETDGHKEDALGRLLQQYQPSAVFYPHAHDHHPVHIAVHHGVEQAFSSLHPPSSPSVLRIQTEYWHPMKDPNLLVECPPDDLALLMEALACHRGEVERNPYHRSLPAWMIDNVRRGAECVQAPGSKAPAFPFGTLYRVEPALPDDWIGRWG